MYPTDFGFYMPAEWEKHMGTLMEWPNRAAEWPGPYDEILNAYSKMALTIANYEPVLMLVNKADTDEAKSYCKEKIKLVEIEHDDSWMRDNGPTFIRNDKSELCGINWGFNAWGGKYPYEKDDLVASRVLNMLDIPTFDAPFILEGGSIHTDGEGTLLTTEECLLNKNRNPSIDKEKLEEELKKYLGVKKVIWLKEGLYGDDTDGHIDNVACFVKPGVILLQTTRDKNNPNYERTLRNLELLKNTTDASGRKLEIIELPQPDVAEYDGVGLTLSYMNFYFVNGGIVMPVFGGKHTKTDEEAASIMREVFKDRIVSTIDGLTLIRGGGNVHCLTQQMPYGLPAKSIQEVE
jgi:agmatine deiminase